jgi:hypothetical protein
VRVGNVKPHAFKVSAGFPLPVPGALPISTASFRPGEVDQVNESIEIAAQVASIADGHRVIRTGRRRYANTRLDSKEEGSKQFHPGMTRKHNHESQVKRPENPQNRLWKKKR